MNNRTFNNFFECVSVLMLLSIVTVASAQTPVADSVKLGTDSGSGTASIAVGHGASANNYSIAIGSLQYFPDEGSYLSDNTTAYGNSVSLGGLSKSYNNSIAIGNSSYASGNSIAIGSGISVLSTNSLSIGYNSYVIADGGSALGSSVTAFAKGAVALGQNNIGDKRRDGTTVISSTANALDPVLTLGNGLLSSQRANAFTVYRDGSARFEGPVQIKAGSGYLTVQPSGTTSRILTLPDRDGVLLANTSPLDATKLTNTVPLGSLPVSVTQVGATVNLDSAEVEGNLPWSRVAGTPTTQAGYGISDGLAVARNAAGRITTAIRIEPQGDIPMLAAQ